MFKEFSFCLLMRMLELKHSEKALETYYNIIM